MPPPELWGCRRAPVSEPASKELSETLYLPQAGKMLGAEVGWVEVSSHLPELKVLFSDSLLDPQALRVDMPEFPKAAAATDAYRGRAVSPHANSHGNAEIL